MTVIELSTRVFICSTIKRSSSTLDCGEDKDVKELSAEILRAVITYTLKAPFFLLSFLLSFPFSFSLFSLASFFLASLAKISLARLGYAIV